MHSRRHAHEERHPESPFSKVGNGEGKSLSSLSDWTAVIFEITIEFRIHYISSIKFWFIKITQIVSVADWQRSVGSPNCPLFQGIRKGWGNSRKASDPIHETLHKHHSWNPDRHDKNTSVLRSKTHDCHTWTHTHKYNTPECLVLFEQTYKYKNRCL